MNRCWVSAHADSPHNVSDLGRIDSDPLRQKINSVATAHYLDGVVGTLGTPPSGRGKQVADVVAFLRRR